MKKSQVLAAIALAFALGVVAPVANISNANTVSAFSVEDKTATGAEVSNAIAAVSSNGTYKQAVALINAYNTYTKGDAAGDYADFVVTNAGKIVDAMKDALGKSSDPDGSYELAGIKDDNTSATPAETEAVIEAVQANGLYAAYAQLNSAIESNNLETLKSAVIAYDNYQKSVDGTATGIDTSKNGEGEVAETFASLKTAVTTAVTGLGTKFTATDTAIDTAEKNIAAYNAGLTVLAPIVTPADGVLSGAGKSALNAIKTSVDQYDLSKYAGLIATTSDTVYYADNFSFSLGDWAKVYTAVEDAGYTDDAASGANYTKIENIAKQYKAAIKSSADTTAIAAELAGYTPEPGVELTTLNNGTYGITVTGEFPEGAALVVTPHTDKIAALDGRNVLAYDIEIVDAEGKAIDFKGTASVAIRVTGAIEGANSDVYFIDADGKAVKLDATFAEGYMNFNTTHFSLYAIAERASTTPGEDDTKPTNPTEDGVGGNLNGTNTGIMSSNDATAKTSVSIMAAIATALTAAGAAIIAFRRNRAAKK